MNRNLIPFLLIFVLHLMGTKIALGQEFIDLWPVNKIPISKYQGIQDSVFNERIYRVGIPKIQVFFPGKQENKGAAVIICPGGGYSWLAYMTSGNQLAKWLNTLGITAFVLHYRLPGTTGLSHREIVPLMDAQRAFRIVRANAAKWGLHQDKIGVLGTSSGGHLAATLATIKEDVASIKDSLDTIPFNPDFMILLSPVIDMSTTYAHEGSVKNLLGPTADQKLKEKFSLQLQVSSDSPPCFLVTANNDQVVEPRNSEVFYHALQQKKVPVSFHAFSQGGHSIALRNNPGATEMWTSLCELWMMESGFIQRK